MDEMQLTIVWEPVVGLLGKSGTGGDESYNPLDAPVFGRRNVEI